MWFVILSILLTTTPLHGYEDTLLPLKELYYEVSTVAKSLKGLDFGSDPSLVENTKKVLEEYLPLDISSGLPEQTSEETRKAVTDGLEVLGNVKEIESDGSQLGKIVYQEVEKIGKRIEVDIDFSQGKIYDIVHQLTLSTGTISHMHNQMDVYFRRDFNPTGVVKTLWRIGYEFFEEYYDAYFKEIESIGIHPLSFEFLEKMKSEIAIGKERIETIKELRDLSQKILAVKEEIEVIEEFRDSKTVEKILKLLEKLKTGYESMRGLIGLENLEWRIVYSTQRLAPIQNYLKNLKISTGDLTDPIKKIEMCLADYDFSMDFSKEGTEFEKIEEVIKEVQKLEAEHEELWRLPTKYRKIIGPQMQIELKAWLDKDPYGEHSNEKLSDSRIEWLHKIVDKVNKTETDEMFKRMDSKVEFLPEKWLKAIRNSLKKLDFDAIKYLSNGIPMKFSKINELLNCYSALKVVPTEVKSLMDQPQKIWNFDARLLDYAAQTVYFFKEAHRFLMEQKQPAVTQEDVTGITDGLKVLKAILDFQQFWIKNSAQHPTVTLEIRTNISDILIPSEPHLDALIDFYSTQYQGGQRPRILKTLKGIKEVSSSFSTKLEKMNEAVTRMKGLNPGSQGAQNPQEPEYVDCSEVKIVAYLSCL